MHSALFAHQLGHTVTSTADAVSNTPWCLTAQQTFIAGTTENQQQTYVAGEQAAQAGCTCLNHK